MCWVGSACNDLIIPFVARTDDEIIPQSVPQAVCGRIASSAKTVRTSQASMMGVLMLTHPTTTDCGDTGEGQFNWRRMAGFGKTKEANKADEEEQVLEETPATKRTDDDPFASP